MILMIGIPFYDSQRSQGENCDNSQTYVNSFRDSIQQIQLNRFGTVPINTEPTSYIPSASLVLIEYMVGMFPTLEFYIILRWV